MTVVSKLSRCGTLRIPICVALLLSNGARPRYVVAAQSGAPSQQESDATWVGRRIVTLQGFGDYFVMGDKGEPLLVHPNGLGVNIVVGVQRVEADRLWIRANGAGDEATGWVDRRKAVLLDAAISYFTARIEQNSRDWDSYLRRAESEHALNQRETALADYTRAIGLHPDEPFLFLRRGRHYRTMGACSEAVDDFERAARLNPLWGELYSQAAGVYVDCPDPTRRSPEKAIALIEHAIALDVDHPTYLTVLALAYFRSGQIEKAVVTQLQALESPRFPTGYREDATKQLRLYEEALAAKKVAQH